MKMLLGKWMNFIQSFRKKNENLKTDFFWFLVQFIIFWMIRSFLRRNHLFLINFTSASGLLASSDIFVQIFYEKKKKLDEKRLCTYSQTCLSKISKSYKSISRGSTCYWSCDGCRRACMVFISWSNDCSTNLGKCFEENISRSSYRCTVLYTHIHRW